MNYSFKKTTQLLFPTLLILFITQFSFAEDWRPITQKELQMTEGKVEKDADAEAIFWEVRVEDKYDRKVGFYSILEHYVRIKILTDRGVENNNKVHIPFGRFHSDGARVSVSNISAKTTKSDGTEVFLDDKDIFEQVIAKTDGVKVKGKSFVFPGIEKGSVIEYQWKEIRRETFSFYVRLELTRSIPIQMIRYYVKPIQNPNFRLTMRIHPFIVSPNFKEESKGFYSLTSYNIKSFKEEPSMPPEYRIKPWFLVYYVNNRLDTNISEDKYWLNSSKSTYKSHESIYKNKNEIRNAAREAIGDTNDELEAVKRVFNYCRAKIKNINDDAYGLSDDEREDIKVNKSERDTLKRGQGTGHDINMLFAAMLHEAGFDVRVAKSTLRNNPKFNKNLLNNYFLNAETIAVRIKGKWHFFDPALQHLPFGMNSWMELHQDVLISDKEKLIWESMPFVKPEQSQEKRTIKAKLGEDGELMADVQIEFTGYLAQFYKESFDEESEQEINKSVIQSIKRQTSNETEVSDLTVENIKEPEKALIYKFKIRIPDYAQKTGKRMFIVPNIFEKNSNPRFTSSERTNPIFFRYAWSEVDKVSIELPDGYKIETAENPKDIKDTRNLGSHKSTVDFDVPTRTLKYDREFMFGNAEILEFNADSYDALKKLFEFYNQRDKHLVTLIVDE